jgi:hypothetical protein
MRRCLGCFLIPTLELIQLLAVSDFAWPSILSVADVTIIIVWRTFFRRKWKADYVMQAAIKG